MKKIAVFCGARSGVSEDLVKLTKSYGRWMALQGWTLVYGGGRVGLMGILADEVLLHGGSVIGVIPQSLVDKESAHHGLTKLHIVQTMHERKKLMSDLADGFLTLPGGFGTLDEICEIITWRQLGFHQKPIAFANDTGFFNGFIDFIHQLEKQSFVSSLDVERIQFLKSPDQFRWEVKS